MASRIAILTISDSRDVQSDRSGPAVAEALREFGFDEFAFHLIPDGFDSVRNTLIALAPNHSAILTTGGTGFSSRDLTPDATAAVLDRRADSICELMRLRGLEQTEFSHLCRGVAGMIGRTFVLNLPGSPRAAAFGVRSIGNLLTPILRNLEGLGCDAAPHHSASE